MLFFLSLYYLSVLSVHSVSFSYGKPRNRRERFSTGLLPTFVIVGEPCAPERPVRLLQPKPDQNTQTTRTLCEPRDSPPPLYSIPRPAIQGVRAAVQAGDLAEAATYVKRFREIDAGALADSGEMVDMDEAVKG